MADKLEDDFMAEMEKALLPLKTHDEVQFYCVMGFVRDGYRTGFQDGVQQGKAWRSAEIARLLMPEPQRAQ